MSGSLARADGDGRPGRCHTLNLGSGRKKIPTAVNLDINPSTHPNVVYDLNRQPWPFRDNQFREVLAYDIIEHLVDIVAVMEEIHRVCDENAVVRITVPHFSSAWMFPAWFLYVELQVLKRRP